MMRVLATVAFVGYMRPASGTWGSLAAFPLAWALFTLGGPIALAAGIVIAFAVGVPATRAVMETTGNSDPSEVVLDEVVGQWIALMPVAIGAAMTGASVFALWPGLVTAFFAFRLFDIWKPGPIGWADRRHDAMGVMLDDVIAGVFAALTGVALAAMAHLVLM
jgi:phosphatidylglycerophosphatase A